MAVDYFNTDSNILITCNPEIPNILAGEIQSLGFKVKEISRLNITTKGTLKDCIYLNYGLRTANRVYYEIAEFALHQVGDLYGSFKKIQWENILTPDATFSIHSYTNHEEVKDTRYPNLVAKDAIVDSIRNKTGRRPNSTSSREFAGIYFYWNNNKCQVFIDTSGETIAKHGYRENPFKAPLQESLASALLFTTHWNSQLNLINPMCGSGTVAIEAALFSRNIVPGRFRKNWGFMHVNGFRRKYLSDVANSFKRKELPSTAQNGKKIWASDISKYAIRAAENNALTAEILEDIKFEIKDFKNLKIPDGEGIIIMNPEYGERLGEDKDLEVLYAEIGDFLKHKCPGKMAYVFTGNLELAKKVGLKPKRKTPFYNAKIECRLLEYELYEGSKKAKKVNA